MTPELQQQYDALYAAANGGSGFAELWNALPEGLRRYIKFKSGEDAVFGDWCREKFQDRPGRQPSALSHFEGWERNQDSWPSKDYENPKDDKTRLISPAEIAAKVAELRAGDRSRR